MIRISDRSMNEAVSWEDLRDVAGSVFDIWCDGSEQQWAEQAWKYTSKAGLAAYQDELGHTQVLIRFLGLAGIYHDFWHVAWEEPSEPDYGIWAEELNLSPIRVGMLLGRDRHLEKAEFDADHESDMHHAVRYLSGAERDKIFPVLRDGFGFGGVSGLFISLWETARPMADVIIDNEEGLGQTAMEGDEGLQTDEEIITDEGMGKAYLWVEEGCRPYGPES